MKQNSNSLFEKLIKVHKSVLNSSVLLKDYMCNLKSISKYYIIGIIVSDTATKIKETLVFSELGAKETLSYRSAYIFISSQGKIVYENKDDLKVNTLINFEFGKIEMQSCSYNAKETSYLFIENIGNIPLHKTGSSVIVLNPINGELIDNVCFDCFNNITVRGSKIIGKVTEESYTNSINITQKLNDNFSLMYQKSANLFCTSGLRTGEDSGTLKKKFFLNFPKATGMLRQLNSCSKFN